MNHRIRFFMQRFSLFLLIFLLSFKAFSHTDPTQPPTQTIAQRNYIKLQEALPIYEKAAEHSWPTLSSNKLLKLKTKSSVILSLRERLKITGDLPEQDDIAKPIFDSHLASAVKNFQVRHGLKPDGIVGPMTFEALNVSPAERVKQIQVNMERWEKLSDKLGNRFIMVNVPDFRFDLIEDNQTVLSMKVIVGRPTRQTPELSSMVTRIVFNPYWDVPDMIARRDIVPKVLDDPDYLNKMNFKIFQNQNDNARQISQYDVDWIAAEDNGLPYHLRQEPGEKNALGLVKFEFQNTYDVYLHDTPAKELFDQDIRDFSSGCVRLEKPFDLVAYFLKDDPDWNDERIQETLDTGKIHYVKIARPIPIYITYMTAWVDENGRMQFRDDVYQRDTDNPQPFAEETAE